MLKATDPFTNAISAHLESVAKLDPLFAETFKKPTKNIADCINYILATVQKSGKMGYADEEVYGMAMHYYDEDDLKPVTVVKGRVIVNHSIAAPAAAVAPVKQVIAAPIPEVKKAAKKIEKDLAPVNQTSLFG